MLYLGSAILFVASLASAACDADNCLRALRATQVPGRLESAQAFCGTFTKTAVAASSIPTYAAEACQPNQNANLTVRISSACDCIAASTTTGSSSSTTTAPSATGSACAIVSQLSASQVATAPSGMQNTANRVKRKANNHIATPTVPAKLAQECLNSVPLNKDAALKLVNEIEPYLEWQSGMYSWLKLSN